MWFVPLWGFAAHVIPAFPFHLSIRAARTEPTEDDRKELIIDLTHQKLYALDQGVLIRTIPVSTGVSPKWVTPTGIFWIYRRVRDDHMVGGQPGTPDHWDVDHVPYAQYFYGGIAIHGAWWNHRFGVPKSHGCIQVPTDKSPQGPTGQPADAEWLWQFAQVGTPVIIMGKTPPTPTTKPLPYPSPSPLGPTSARFGASLIR